MKRMEFNEIEKLINKYLEGNTSLHEEKVLKDYFSSDKVEEKLKEFQYLFVGLSEIKNQSYSKEIVFLEAKSNKKIWLSIAASVCVLLGIGYAFYLNTSVENNTILSDLGTFKSPEIAFEETQKALELLSTHVNTGIKSVRYINEYENSKNLIFK
jgi:hypothetical protein